MKACTQIILNFLNVIQLLQVRSLFDMHKRITIPSQSTSSHWSIVVAQSHEVVDWSPSNSRNFLQKFLISNIIIKSYSIEKPVSSNSAQMRLFNISDSGSDFSSWDNSVKVSFQNKLFDFLIYLQELVSEGLSNVISGFLLE